VSDDGFEGQCHGYNLDGERCAYTEHPQAPEYHSWVRLVQS